MKEVKVNKNVLRRRQLKKFGDASRAPPGPEENITYLSNEIIHLDLKPKRRGEEKEEGLSSLDKLQNSQFRCRNCGELGHWTLKCPKRSEIKPVGIAEIKEEGGAGGDSNKYVPPSMRNRGVRGLGSSDRTDDSLSVRVTNLSEDVTEQDLHELVRRFGNTSRIFLAKDRNTQKSRGFAFISFYDRTSAEACIQKLNGHGYDNLILHVEWAKPREMDAPAANKDAKPAGGKF